MVQFEPGTTAANGVYSKFVDEADAAEVISKM